MYTCSVAHDTVTATVFAGYLDSLQRDPTRWRWPDSTSAYLQHRLETLAVDLLQTGATETVVA